MSVKVIFSPEGFDKSGEVNKAQAVPASRSSHIEVIFLSCSRSYCAAQHSEGREEEEIYL